jgi:hypothetical protein
VERAANFLICRYHKTAQWYGEAGKYVPDSLRKAFDVFLRIPRGQWSEVHPDSFWIGGAPRMSDALGDFCELIGLGVKMSPTVIRKLFVTTVGELVSEPT